MKKTEQSSLLINLRFALLLVASIVVLIMDVRMKMLSEFRYYLETALYPVLVFADSPRQVSEAVSSQFKSRSDLIAENEKLASENFVLAADLMRLHSLEQENAAMRKFLNSPMHETSQRTFAEIIDVDSDPYLKRVAINRGSSSGIAEGMPVITDEGLVGQVISSNYAYSRVLLLIDPSSSIPVIDTRNQVRAIATGNGSHDELIITNVPRSTDIQKGDLLTTSGLGGVFPAGFPVAIVTEVGFSESQPFALVKAKPVVNIDTMRYVLVILSQKDLQGKGHGEMQPKERTDGKKILREARIKSLINSMTNTRMQNANKVNKESHDGQ